MPLWHNKASIFAWRLRNATKNAGIGRLFLTARIYLRENEPASAFIKPSAKFSLQQLDHELYVTHLSDTVVDIVMGQQLANIAKKLFTSAPK